MVLIPTRYKERLPAGYSYPVGAQALSTALEGVPCYADQALAFCWKDVFWASQYQARIASEGELVVLEAHYFYEWSLRVNSVPGALASDLREALIESALPELARTLSSTPREPDSFHWVAGLALSS